MQSHIEWMEIAAMDGYPFGPLPPELGGLWNGNAADIGVNQNSFCGETLGTVAGYGLSVVEVAMLSGVEFNLPLVIESSADLAVGCDGLDDSEVPVGDSESLIGCGELDAVANIEVMCCTPKDVDPGQPAWIVRDEFAGFLLDRQ